MFMQRTNVGNLVTNDRSPTLLLATTNGQFGHVWVLLLLWLQSLCFYCVETDVVLADSFRSGSSLNVS